MLQINELIKKYGIVSDQVEPAELSAILNRLSIALEKQPLISVVEMGCYVGTTSLYISRLLKARSPMTDFHVYDSFAGLPDKTAKDSSPAGTQFKTGELNASKAQLIQNYKKAGLKLPVIHKAWFEDLTPADLPDDIGFAFLDGDYYSSVISCLRLIQSKLTNCAIIIVDDYQNEALPGAQKAVDEWLIINHDWRLNIQASLAILTKVNSL